MLLNHLLLQLLTLVSQLYINPKMVTQNQTS